MTLAAVALLAGLVKKGAQSDLATSSNMSSASPYSIWEVLTWAGVGAASGLVAHLAPNAFGLHQATVAAPFFICATVVGFLLGSQYVNSQLSFFRLPKSKVIQAAYLIVRLCAGCPGLSKNSYTLLSLQQFS